MVKLKKITLGIITCSLLLTGCQGAGGTAKTDPVALQDTSFLDKMEQKPLTLDFKESTVHPKIPDYTIAADLSNVENLDQFGSFTPKQKELLAKNGFVLAKPKNSLNLYMPEEEWNYEFDQIHQIYEDNEYQSFPSFVTTDSVTHIFHIFYDGFLRSLERDQLYPKTKAFNHALLQENLALYQEMTDPDLKSLQEKNIAFIATGLSLLGEDPGNLPQGIQGMVQEELAKAQAQSPDECLISGKMVDYSQLIPRGHYTSDNALKAYFQGTMYYGQVGLFPEENPGSLIQGLLLTHSIYKNPDLLKAWEDLVEPIDFLVETSDDLSIRDYARVLYGVYGKDFSMEDLKEEKKLAQANQVIASLPEPKIAPLQGKSFRLLPQRAVMDNVLMQNVVDPAQDGKPSDRPIYTGLDLMAAFGNQKAYDLLMKDPYNSHWPQYPEKTKENIQTVENFTLEDWQKNLYRGWLWMLASYKESFGQGYPGFMQNEAWQRKDLISALGSYTELKHDTLLYGKAVMAEMGAGGEEELPKSYVEPNVGLYDKLNWLLDFTKTNLKERDLLTEAIEAKLTRFQALVQKLLKYSIKELENQPFSDKEFEDLYYIGGEMESVMVDFLESTDENQVQNWYEIQNPTDRRIPVVADLMRIVSNTTGLPEGQIAHIATGRPFEIFAIYPHQGKLYMGRGGTFSYFEPLGPDRLTDEVWQKRVYDEMESYPSWYQDLVSEEKTPVNRIGY